MYKKRIIAWLMAVALLLSLIPAGTDFVFADGEDMELEGWYVYVNTFVQTCAVSEVAGYGQEDFSIEIPQQDFIEPVEENNWKATGTFTVNITVPEGYDMEFFYIHNNGEEMDLSETLQLVSNNVYELRVNPVQYNGSVSLEFFDKQYYAVDGMVSTMEGCYTYEAESNPTISYIAKSGGNYTFSIKATVPNGENPLDNLEYFVNEELMNNEDLSLEGTENLEDGLCLYTYSYTIEDVQNQYRILVADVRQNVQFAMFQIPESWEVYKENLEKVELLEIDNGKGMCMMNVPYRKAFTVYVKPDRESGFVLQSGKDNTSFAEGEKQSDSMIKFQLQADKESFYYNILSKHILQFSGAEALPCDEMGNLVSGQTAVSQMEVISGVSSYFRVTGSFRKYHISINGMESSVDQDGETVGEEVISFTPSEEDEEVIYATITPYYYVKLVADDKVCSEDYSDSFWDEESEITTYYYAIVNGEAMVSFLVGTDYDISGMKVFFEDSQGSRKELENPEIFVEEDRYRIQYFLSGLTGDGTIEITDIKHFENLEVFFESNLLTPDAITVFDEKGNALNLEQNEESVIAKVVADGTCTVKVEGVSDSGWRMIAQKRDTGIYEIIQGTQEDNSVIYSLSGYEKARLMGADKVYLSTPIGVAVIEYPTEEYADTYIPKTDSYSFYLKPEAGKDLSHAVVSVEDLQGNPIPVTIRDQVEVGNFGEKTKVYTITVTKDFNIVVEGIVPRSYNVYVPTTFEDYEISSLYLKSEEFEDVWDEVSGEVVDSDRVYQSEYEKTVGFFVKTQEGKLPPYITRVTTDDNGETQNAVVSFYKIPQEDAMYQQGYDTYRYTFSINGMEEIAFEKGRNITVYTSKTQDSVLYRSENGVLQYGINLENPEQENRECYLELQNLYPVMPLRNATVSIQLWKRGLYVPKEYENQILYYQNSAGKWIALQVKESSDDVYFEYEIPADCTEMYLDVQRLEMMQYFFTVEEDSFEEADVSWRFMDGYTYEANLSGEYESKDGYVYVTLTADTWENLDSRMLVPFSGAEQVGSTELEDGGVERSYCITLSQPIQEIAFREKASISYDYQGVKGIESIWVTMGDYEYYPAGMQLQVQVMVEEGYVPRSVVLVQSYGEEKTHEYEVTDYGYTERDTSCVIKLEPGENILGAKSPKKSEYNITCAQSLAFQIKPVAGSQTTVGYQGSFSFTVSARNGYDLSKAIVSANGNKVTPNANGVYTIRNIDTDYEITVSGFRKKAVTVNFVDYNGKILKSQAVEIGKNAVPPAKPTRKGYQFVGWIGKYTSVSKDCVVRAEYKVQYVSRIKITGKTTKLKANQTITLKTVVSPSNARNKAVNWTSSNKKYAVVDAKGNVKVLSAGAGKTVTIFATAKDGSGVKASYKITIENNLISKLKLSAKAKKLKAGKMLAISVKYTPSKNINKKLAWTSSNKKYATVNSKGIVTAKKAGKGKTVTITAKAKDGSDKKATIRIRII